MDHHTLYPRGDAAADLPRFDATRVIVEYQGGHLPRLTDEWQPVTLADGRKAEVRRADCGAGCRCAGEVRIGDDTDAPLGIAARAALAGEGRAEG